MNKPTRIQQVPAFAKTWFSARKLYTPNEQRVFNCSGKPRKTYLATKTALLTDPAPRPKIYSFQRYKPGNWN